MHRPVANLCCVWYCYLLELRRVWRYLTHETAVKVANAMISSRLDYYNSLLYHSKKTNISRLQRIQNTPCCIVCKLSKFSHVAPFLHKLHWLPIQYRILFKYNIITYKAINFSQLPYLSSLIKSSDLTQDNRLSVSSTRPNKCMGMHSFAVATLTEWNKLPQAVRTQDSINGFRQHLKTYLFRSAYPQP